MKRNLENAGKIAGNVVEKLKEEQQSDSDSRSICVKNVDYKTEPNELKEYFGTCGGVARITIFRDPITHHPLGYCSPLRPWI
ncbi:MAG: hypothetical protein P4L10_12720 [Acidobacteriaceae bacterium]|nr:hypothetical protein [Acidobacteriaceae bacterium]